jgi:hypothetical protein
VTSKPRALTRDRLRALHGPPGARVLADFLDLYRDGDIPHNATTDELARAFRAILAGADPKLALKLTRAGRKHERLGNASYQRKLKIGHYIAQAAEMDGQRGKIGRAQEQAAREFNVGQKRIEQIWGEVRPLMQVERGLMRHMAPVEQALRALRSPQRNAA